MSYRDLAEMMSERGLGVVHTTIFRWVQHFAPELEKRIRPHLKPSNASWRVDETYVKVRGHWMYLYRAVDSAGNTLDFLLSATRSTRAAKRFFRKLLGNRMSVKLVSLIRIKMPRIPVPLRHSKQKMSLLTTASIGFVSTSTMASSRTTGSSSGG